MDFAQALGLLLTGPGAETKLQRILALLNAAETMANTMVGEGEYDPDDALLIGLAHKGVYRQYDIQHGITLAEMRAAAAADDDTVEGNAG